MKDSNQFDDDDDADFDDGSTVGSTAAADETVGAALGLVTWEATENAEECYKRWAETILTLARAMVVLIP